MPLHAHYLTRPTQGWGPQTSRRMDWKTEETERGGQIPDVHKKQRQRKNRYGIITMLMDFI